MSCPINESYPGYLKSILKEIAAGNDPVLKACACNLKSPKTTEGCAVVDEDNRIGGFPFCWEFTEDLSKVGDGTFNPIKLKLKDAMFLYWLSKNTSQQISWTEPDVTCTPSLVDVYIKIISNNMLKTDPSTGEPIKAKKELVCRKNITVNSKYISSGGCPTAPQDYSYDFIIGEFFAVAAGFCLESVSLKQYYIREGNEYYFYPSFVYGYNGYWNYIRATDKETATPPPDCGVNPCKSTVSQMNLNININQTDYNIKTYFYQGYVPLGEGCQTKGVEDFNQGNLTITE